MGFFSEKKLKQVSSEKKKIKQHTILIVDDEKENLTNLKGILDYDYHVLTADDGKDALELLQKAQDPERIHLIISDQRMPILSGVEFLEQTIPIIPHCIRIILTAYADVEAIINAVNKGQIYKFILKPYDREDMLLTVKRALQTFELEDQNVLLTSINNRLEGMNQSKESLLTHVNSIYQNELKAIKGLLQQGIQGAQESDTVAIQNVAKEVYQIEETLRPITSLYFSEISIKNKRVLLAESNKKQQVVAKMALGGSGVTLDIASNLEQGAAFLEKQSYEVLCVDSAMISLASLAREKYPMTQLVFMTPDDAPTYITTLREYPYLSNIVSRNDEDRSFTVRNILTTVRKLLNDDLFGLEKYLNWGVEVHQLLITKSGERIKLIEEMETDLSRLGVHRPVLAKCAGVVEELIMNAVYNAPTTPSGKHKYAHLPLTTSVELEKEEYATFRYACDGFLLGVSVEDPFGAFNRDTILDYLESCYSGKAGSLQNGKGGAGRGLFQIMSTSDLVVWNVKRHFRTEVIALFNVDPNAPKSGKTTSFHYFLS